jgi:hypothetical protein
VDDLRREKDEIRRMYDKSQRADTVRELEKKHAEDLKASKVVCFRGGRERAKVNLTLIRIWKKIFLS